MSPERDAEDAGIFPDVSAGLLFVPVRPARVGCAARLFRTPLGGRTAVGFTTENRLTGVLGRDHPWITLAEPAIRALVAPLGITTLTVDPYFVTRPVQRTLVPAFRERRADWGPRAVTAPPSPAAD